MEHNLSTEAVIPITPLSSSRTILSGESEPEFLARQILFHIVRQVVAEDEILNEVEDWLPDMTKKIELWKELNCDDYKKMSSAIRSEFGIKKKLGRLNEQLSLNSKIREFGHIVYSQLLYKRIQDLQTELVISYGIQKNEIEVMPRECMPKSLLYVGGSILAVSLLANIGLTIGLFI
jgi:hypothetical protein